MVTGLVDDFGFSNVRMGTQGQQRARSTVFTCSKSSVIQFVE